MVLNGIKVVASLQSEYIKEVNETCVLQRVRGQEARNKNTGISNKTDVKTKGCKQKMNGNTMAQREKGNYGS